MKPAKEKGGKGFEGKGKRTIIFTRRVTEKDVTETCGGLNQQGESRRRVQAL